LLPACRIDDPRAPQLASRIPAGLERRFLPPSGWTWGLVQPAGAPAARYGVAAPSGRPQGDILILASYGEPAEVWFETVNELVAENYVVWVLEPVGQGGSGRYGLIRDVGDAPNLGPDVEATRLMTDHIVRRRPLVVIASGSSAPAALLALGSGAPADGLVLSAPRLTPEPAATLDQAGLIRTLHLDALPSQRPWSWDRSQPDDRALGFTHDSERGRLRMVWQVENPSLRMAGPSWRWRTAFSAAAAEATGPAGVRLQLPVLILPPGRGSAEAGFCGRLKSCTLQHIGPAGAEPELEADPVRTAWLSAVKAFAAQVADDFPGPPARARLPAKG
jgi:lysophospholipase